jgi:Protein of unknown function (DUF1822)
MNPTDPLTVQVAITPEAHRWAEQFAAEQVTPEKGKQVYLNTLAVCAVQEYLKWLSIRSRLDQSDCWNPGLRSLLNIADLTLPNLGKLECRPILPHQTTLEIPVEATEDRIGYVVARFNVALDSAEILGFAPNVRETLAIADLRSLDDLLDVLLAEPQPVTQLQQWLAGIFSENWQPPELAIVGFRSAGVTEGVRRAREIELHLDSCASIVLVIELMPSETNTVHLNVKLYPNRHAQYLPEHLAIQVVEENGNVGMEANTRSHDNLIQLEFYGELGERFDIQIELENTTLVEKFII